MLDSNFGMIDTGFDDPPVTPHVFDGLGILRMAQEMTGPDQSYPAPQTAQQPAMQTSPDISLVQEISKQMGLDPTDEASQNLVQGLDVWAQTYGSKTVYDTVANFQSVLDVITRMPAVDEMVQIRNYVDQCVRMFNTFAQKLRTFEDAKVQATKTMSQSVSDQQTMQGQNTAPIGQV